MTSRALLAVVVVLASATAHGQGIYFPLKMSK